MFIKFKTKLKPKTLVRILINNKAYRCDENSFLSIPKSDVETIKYLVKKGYESHEEIIFKKQESIIFKDNLVEKEKPIKKVIESKKEPEEKSLFDHTFKELKAILDNKGIKYSTKAKKYELIELLED